MSYPQPMPYGGVPEYGVDEETVRFDRPSGGRPHRPGRRRSVVLSLITATLVASGVVGGGFFLLGRTAEAPAAAVVGDCLARSGSGAVIVPCADPQAAFTVLGRLDGRTRIEAGITACSPFAATTDVYLAGQGRRWGARPGALPRSGEEVGRRSGPSGRLPSHTSGGGKVAFLPFRSRWRGTVRVPG